jgi:hypothetical protein
MVSFLSLLFVLIIFKNLEDRLMFSRLWLHFERAFSQNK